MFQRCLCPRCSFPLHDFLNPSGTTLLRGRPAVFQGRLDDFPNRRRPGSRIHCIASLFRRAAAACVACPSALWSLIDSKHKQNNNKLPERTQAGESSHSTGSLPRIQTHARVQTSLVSGKFHKTRGECDNLWALLGE